MDEGQFRRIFSSSTKAEITDRREAIRNAGTSRSVHIRQQPLFDMKQLSLNEMIGGTAEDFQKWLDAPYDPGELDIAKKWNLPF